jgi:Fe-S-cluster formation regulator IscX/YfhJ
MKKSDIERIIESLEVEYPDENLEELAPEEIYDLIVELNLFADVFQIDDEVLEKVHEGWLKLRSEML